MYYHRYYCSNTSSLSGPPKYFLKEKLWHFSLELVSAIFYRIYIFHQMIALHKLWKMFFFSSKKLFSFLRYSNFCIFVFFSFFPCHPLLWRLIQEKYKVYDVINCLNKNLITIYLISRERNKVWHWNSVHWYSIKHRKF